MRHNFSSAASAAGDRSWAVSTTLQWVVTKATAEPTSPSAHTLHYNRRTAPESSLCQAPTWITYLATRQARKDGEARTCSIATVYSSRRSSAQAITAEYLSVWRWPAFAQRRRGREGGDYRNASATESASSLPLRVNTKLPSAS